MDFKRMTKSLKTIPLTTRTEINFIYSLFQINNNSRNYNYFLEYSSGRGSWNSYLCCQQKGALVALEENQSTLQALFVRLLKHISMS